MKINVKSAICYADSARGVYIPQYVAETIDRSQIKYFSDWETLESGPHDNESYWEAWDDFLNNAETIDGRVFYQDGDLWIVDADNARQAFNDYCQSQLDYEESHVDAGNSYAHLPAESWSITDELSLNAYLIAQDIDTCGLGIDTIADILLDSFKMYQGSIYGPYDLDKDDCILAVYPIQEVEIQFDHDSIGIDGITWDYIKESVEPYVNGDYAYMTTDAVWFAGIKRDKLQECIRDHAASLNN